MRERNDIAEEIAQHLEDRYEELRAQGLSHEQASRDAERQVRHLARELNAVGQVVPGPPSRPHDPIASLWGSWGSIWLDFRYACRMLAKRPGFSAVVIVTLALGIGATTAIFSVVDGVMLRPLPFPKIDRILMLRERTIDGRAMSVSWPDFQDWQQQNTVFDHVGVFRPTSVNLTGGDRAERLDATLASSGLFGAMGLQPILGRAFSEAEDRAGTDRVAVISERLWRRRFGGDPSLVGRTIALSGDTYSVIGVMPQGMRFPSRLTDVWLPLGLFVDGMPPRGAHPGLTAVARMKAGTTLERAETEMDTIAQRLAAQYPASNKNTRVIVTPYYEQIVQNIRPALVALTCAVAVVLLIGCANLANLTLSKSEARAREIAVRAALGAARWRVVQQLVVESLVLAAAGGLLGALLAAWAVRAFVASQPASIPRIDLIAVDLRVLAFTGVVSIATALLVGLAPALRASAPDLLTTLREASRGTAGVGARRLRAALVVGEIALALVLLVGAGLMVRSFNRLMAINPGFDPERVVTARLMLPEKTYPDRAGWTRFHRELLRRLGGVAGIEAAAVNSAVPLEGGGSEAPVIKEGDAMPTPDRPAATTLFQTTSPGYFQAMGIPLVRGRAFTERDTADAPPVVIVDETLVRKVFGDVNPIGKRIAFELAGGHGPHAEPRWREVVGVVGHVKHYGLSVEPPFVQLYTPIEQLPTYWQPRGPAMALVVRTTMPARTLADVIRGELAAMDRDVPLYGVRTMDDYLAQSTEQQRLSVMLLGGFGGLALVLAVVGIYGVLSYIVGQRTQEIGIRIALGATRRDVLRLVLGQGLRLTALGLAIGLAASIAASRLIASLLYEVSPRDPATLAALAGLLGAVALAAVAVPALRATHVSPIDALRSE